MTTTRNWAMIRVRSRTHARLKQFRDDLHLAYQQGRVELPDSQAEHLTLDFVISNLLDRAMAHRERSRKQKQVRVGKTGQTLSESSLSDSTQGMYTRPATDDAEAAEGPIALATNTAGFSESKGACA